MIDKVVVEVLFFVVGKVVWFVCELGDVIVIGLDFVRIEVEGVDLIFQDYKVELVIIVFMLLLILMFIVDQIFKFVKLVGLCVFVVLLVC